MLKIVVASLDDVEEALRGYYEEKDGKFYLKVEGITEHPQVAQLKTAMARKEEERNKAKKELADLKEKIGGDLPEEWSIDEWLRLKSLEDDDDDKTAEGRAKKKAKEDERLATMKANYESQINNLKTKSASDLEAANKKIQDLQFARANDKADIALDEAMDKANIDPKFRPAVKALHRSKLKNAVEDDENIRIFVETDLGEATVPDYIATWSQSDDGKVYVSQASGNEPNGKKATGGVGGVNPFLKATWNKTEQAALRNDPARLARMATAAGFKDGNSALAAIRALQ